MNLNVIIIYVFINLNPKNRFRRSKSVRPFEVLESAEMNTEQ